jgi:chromosome segregation ATPase
VLALKTQLEDDEYALRLETEGVSLRVKNQRRKDKVALKAAEKREERLEEQVASAAMCTKNLGRKLRVQMEEVNTVKAKCDFIEALAEQEEQIANKLKDDLRNTNRDLKAQIVNLKLEMEDVGALAAKAAKRLSALHRKHSALNVSHVNTKTKLRLLRKKNIELVDACQTGQMALAVAEGRATNMEALECEAVQLAAKLNSAKSELKESQNRVQTLNEVRLFFFITSVCCTPYVTQM